MQSFLASHAIPVMNPTSVSDNGIVTAEFSRTR